MKSHKLRYVNYAQNVFCHPFSAALQNLLLCSCLFVCVNFSTQIHRCLTPRERAHSWDFKTAEGTSWSSPVWGHLLASNHWIWQCLWHVSMYPALLWYRVFFTSICYCNVIIFRFTEPQMTHKTITTFTWTSVI